MDHQPFREWLLSDDPLTAEQSSALQDHLDGCDSCSQINSAWMDVEKVIHESQQVDPEPGFTRRMQARLAAYEHHRQNRQGWVSIGITAVIAAGLVAVLSVQLWPFLREPGPFITFWLSQFVSLISDYFIFHTFITTNTWLRPLNVLVGSFFLMGMISFMSVLWFTAYQKIFILRRIE